MPHLSLVSLANTHRVGTEVCRTVAGRRAFDVVASAGDQQVVLWAAPSERAARSAAQSLDELLAVFGRCADDAQAEHLARFIRQSLRQLA